MVILIMLELAILLPRAIASMSLVRLLYRNSPAFYIATILVSLAVLGGVFLLFQTPGLMTLQLAAWGMAMSIIGASAITHRLKDKSI